MGILVHFSIALFASFLGYLPFGLVNLSVIDNALSRGLRSGIMMSLGAGLVEILECLVAIQFTVLLSKYLERNSFVHVLVFIILVGFGLFFLYKNQRNSEFKKSGKNQQSSLVKGLILSILNPQALPFWVFVITYFKSHDWINFNYFTLPAFVIGGALGRFLTLALYSYLSVTVINNTSNISRIMNKIIGWFLIGLGLYQGSRYLWEVL